MSYKVSRSARLKAVLILVVAAAVVSVCFLSRVGRRPAPSVGVEAPSALSRGGQPGQAGEEVRAQGEASRDVRRKVSEAYGNLPLSFEANRGQAGGDVEFLSRGDGVQLLLSPDGATLAIAHVTPRGKVWKGKSARAGREAAGVRGRVDTLKMGLVGARPEPSLSGEGELAGKANYLRGGDPRGWITDVPTYSGVKYTGVYAGVDLVYYGNQRQLEYDFHVAPGADPAVIGLAFEGARRMEIDRGGDLLLHTAGGVLSMKRPVSYQVTGGVRQEVASRYVVRGGNSVGFELGEYDRGLPLVIDPVLVYSTFAGGAGGEEGHAIAVDHAGNAYITGVTVSTNYPATPGAFQTGTNEPRDFLGFEQGDVFVTKLNAAGNGVVYSTYIGGRGYDDGRGIAVDAAGSAYVAGGTFSHEDFPVTPGAFRTTAPPPNDFGQQGDAFVAKLNPAGSGLAYSTRLAGSDTDDASSVALDASGAAYVTGTTISTDFPVTPGAPQPATGGAWDGFLTKLSPDGSALVHSTYLGGGGADHGTAVAVDSAGHAFVTGSADSSNLPVTPGAIQTVLKGSRDAFVAKWGPTGALVYTTYLGGSSIDSGQGIAADGSGNAYVTGYTGRGAGFPVTPGAYQTGGGSPGSGLYEAFVSKVNPEGTQLVYSTLVGAPNTSASGDGLAVAVNAAGEAFVAGSTDSPDFPVTSDAAQTAYGGGVRDAFLVRLNGAGSGVVYSTFLGGGKTDSASAVALDSSGNAYVAGSTTSAGFPVTPGSFQKFIGGNVNTDQSAFVTKIGAALPVSYSISGRVTDGANGAAGVLVRLSGSLEGTQWTAADGSYSFGNLPPGGAYTVTPSSPYYDFGSQSRTFADLAADQTADFAGVLLRFNISGVVRDAAGNAIPGVTVTLNSNQTSTQTDSAGRYAFNDLPAVGAYAVRPFKQDYFFEPFVRRLNNLAGNQTVDFLGTLAFSIRGRVVAADGRSLTSLVVRLTGSQQWSTSADRDGNYSFEFLPAGGSYTVTPAHSFFDFSPPSRTFENLSGHQTADFVATFKFGSIGGRVTDEGGRGLSGVTVTLGGPQTTTTTSTDFNGNYSFGMLTKGVAYTVTVSQGGFTFEPESFGRVVAGDHRADFYGRRNKLKPFGAGHIITATPGPFQTRAHVVSEYTLEGQLVQSALAPYPPGVAPNAALTPADLVLDRYGDVQIYTGPGAASYLTGSDFAGGGWRYHTYPNWNPWDPANNFEGIATWGDYVYVTDKLQGDHGQPVQTQGIIRISLKDYSAQRFEHDTTFCHLSVGKDGLLYAIPGGTSGSQLKVFNPDTMAPVKTLTLRDAQGASLNVHRVAVNQQGDIYAAEFQLNRYDKTGLLIRRVQLESRLFDVEVADDGTVAAMNLGTVTILDPSLNVIRSFRAPGAYVAFTNTPPPPASAFKFAAAAYAADEGAGSVQIEIVRQGDASGPASVTYATADGTASQSKDYTASYGTLSFAPGETSKSFGVILTDNAYADGSRTVALNLTNSSGAPLLTPGASTLTITDNDAPGQNANPADATTFYVRQHYADFLNRVPDADGLAFWTGGIEACGADAQCREVKRIDTSAAFFLSIEFQETGYFVYRMFKASYGDATSPGVAGTVPVVRLREFLPDTQRIGQGVVVNVGAWREQLEANKDAYALEFVRRQRFQTAFPASMTPAQFIDKLVQNAGLTLAPAERDQLVSELAAAPDADAARASLLRRLAENPALRQAELNRAFVLMQYFGYLRRNPDDAPDSNFAGWKFWLDKLNEFGGDYRRAEMVRAFISSAEYRQRFAP